MRHDKNGGKSCWPLNIHFKLYLLLKSGMYSSVHYVDYFFITLLEYK